MTQLTEFQYETERALNRRLEAIGFVLENRKVLGEKEQYIAGEIQDVKVWIYTDEACVIGRGVDRVFERWDFDSLEELQEAFIRQVLDLL